MKYRWKRFSERINSWYNDPYMEEKLFMIGFILYLGLSVWSTTMFPQSEMVSKICKLSFIICVGTKILLYDRYRMKEILYIILCGICVLGDSIYVTLC